MSDPAVAAAGGDSGTIRDLVEIKLPAVSAYLSVLRTATAGLAARLDFTLDEIEDLRIAVDEACAMLLAQADTHAGGDLTCTFELGSDSLDVAVSVPTVDPALPDQDTFAWTVLTALAGEVSADYSGGRLRLTMHKKRSFAGSA